MACRNGSDYSIDVLEALEDEGYTHIVGLQGGMNALNRIFDLKLNPRGALPWLARRALLPPCWVHTPMGLGVRRPRRRQRWL